jgi:parallel beta-helix repeat protein
MPVTSTATAKEILTASKWNTLVTDINAILAAIGGSNLAWPMTAEDNIDMDGNTIVGMKKFWTIHNAAEYATGNDYNSTAFQAAVDAVEGEGGGCILIPPDTTFVIKDIEVDASGNKPFVIMGCGKSSILQMDSSPTTDMIEFLAGSTDVEICNLQMTGASQGSGKKGVVVKNGIGFKMRNVWMQDFTGDFITLNGNGAGTSTSNVQLTNLLLEDGTTADHIFADDLSYATFSNIISKNCTQTAIHLAPSAQAALMQDIRISNVIVDTPTLHGISIVGVTNPADATHTRIQVSDCQVTSAGDHAYEIGKASALLKYADVKDCAAYSPGAAAFIVGIDYGSITGCSAFNFTDDTDHHGIDLTTSSFVWVSGNNLYDAGDYGIDMGTAEDCVVQNNNVDNAATEDIFKDNLTVTTNRIQSNHGELCPTVSNTHSVQGNFTVTGTSGSWSTFTTYTIPGNTLTDGDSLRITLMGSMTGDSTSQIRVKLGAVTLAAFGLLDESDAAGTYTIYIEDADGNLTHSQLFAGHDEDAPTADSEVYSSTDTSLAVDWTADVVITFEGSTADADDVVALYHYMVEALGGV